MRYPYLFFVLALFTSASLAAQPNSAKTNPDPTASQTQPVANKPSPDTSDRRHSDWPTRTFYLKYATTQNEMNEIATVLRQMLPPPDQTFIVASQDAIVMHAPPEDMTLVQKVLDDLDIPRKSWRLTYTLTEVDGGKRLGSQHYSMVVADGQRATLKQGDRVPITIAPYASVNQNQVTYQDAGMSFDVQLNEMHDGARLSSDITQSSLADDKSRLTDGKPGIAAEDPVFRQSTLRSQADLTPNKPLVLGAMDIPGSTRHLEIEVLMEPLP